MRKDVIVIILCFLSLLLTSCATIEKITTQLGMTTSKEPTKEEQEEWEYGKLVIMGGEFVGWFSRDLKLIGPGEMEEYFKKNEIEPVETEVLEHFASLGWEVVEKTPKDEHTTEYQLKRKKTENINFIYVTD